MFLKLSLCLVHLSVIHGEHPILSAMRHFSNGPFGFVGLKERLNGSMDYIENCLGHKIKFNESIHSFDNISYKYLTECDVKPLNKFLFTTTNMYERNTYRKRFFQQESREAMFTKKYEAKWAKRRASSTQKITRFTAATNLFDSKQMMDNLLEFYPDMVHHLITKKPWPKKVWTGTYPPDDPKEHPNNTTPENWSLDIERTYSDEDYKGPERRLDPKDSVSAYGLSLPKEKVHYADEYNSQLLPELERQWKIRGDKKNIEANLDRPSDDNYDERMYRPAGTHYLAGCKIDLNHYRPFETMNETLNPYLPYNEYYLRPGFDPVAWHRTIRYLHYDINPDSELSDPEIRKLFTLRDSEDCEDIATTTDDDAGEEKSKENDPSGEFNSVDYYRSDIYADSMLTTAELAEKKRRKLLKANKTKKTTSKFKRKFSLIKTAVPFTTKNIEEIRRIMQEMFGNITTTTRRPLHPDESAPIPFMFRQKEELHKIYPNITDFQLQELNEMDELYVREKEILNCTSWTINMQNLRNIELRHNLKLSELPSVPMMYWVHPNRTPYQQSIEDTISTLPPTDFILSQSLESFFNQTPFNIENIRNIERKFNITLNDNLPTEIPDSIVRVNDFLTVRADRSNDYHDLINYFSPLKRRKREILDELKTLLQESCEWHFSLCKKDTAQRIEKTLNRNKRNVENIGSIEHELKRWGNYDDLTKVGKEKETDDTEVIEATVEGKPTGNCQTSKQVHNHKEKSVFITDSTTFPMKNMLDFDEEKIKNMDTEELKKIQEYHNEHAEDIKKYMEQNKDFVYENQGEIIDDKHQKLAKEIQERIGTPTEYDYEDYEESTKHPKEIDRQKDREMREKAINEKIYKLSNIRNRYAPLPGNIVDYYQMKMGWLKTEEPQPPLSHEVKNKKQQNDGKIDPFQQYFKLPEVEDVRYVVPETTLLPSDFRNMNESQVKEYILKHGIDNMLKIVRQRTTMAYKDFKKQRLLESRKKIKGQLEPRPRNNKERINKLFDENWKVKDHRLKRRRTAKKERRQQDDMQKIPFYIKERLKDQRHRYRVFDKKIKIKIDHFEGAIVTQRVTVKKQVGPLHYHNKHKKGVLKVRHTEEVFKIDLVEETTTLKTRKPYDPAHESDYSEEDRPVNKGMNFESNGENESLCTSQRKKPRSKVEDSVSNQEGSQIRETNKDIQKDYNDFNKEDRRKKRKDPKMDDYDLIKALTFYSCESIKASEEIAKKAKDLMKGFRKRRQKLVARRRHAKFYNFTDKSLMSSESDSNDVISLPQSKSGPETIVRNYKYVTMIDGSRIVYEKEYMDSEGNPIQEIVRNRKPRNKNRKDVQKQNYSSERKVSPKRKHFSTRKCSSEKNQSSENKDSYERKLSSKIKDCSNTKDFRTKKNKQKKKPSGEKGSSCSAKKNRRKEELKNSNSKSARTRTSDSQTTRKKIKNKKEKKKTLKRSKRFLRLSTPQIHATKGFYYCLDDPIINHVTDHMDNFHSCENNLCSLGVFDVTTTLTIQKKPDHHMDLQKFEKRRVRRGYEDEGGKVERDARTRTIFTKGERVKFEDILYDPIAYSTFGYESPKNKTREFFLDYGRRKRSCKEEICPREIQAQKKGQIGNMQFSIDILFKNIIVKKQRARRQVLATTPAPVTDGKEDDPLSNCGNNSASRESFQSGVQAVKISTQKPEEERAARVKRGDPLIQDSGASHNLAKSGIRDGSLHKVKMTSSLFFTPLNFSRMPNPTKSKLIKDLEKRFSLNIDKLTTPFSLFPWSPYQILKTEANFNDSDILGKAMESYEERESPNTITVSNTAQEQNTEPEPTLPDFDKMTPFNIENIRNIEKKFNVSLKDFKNHPDNIPIKAKTLGFGLVGLKEKIVDISHCDTLIDKIDPDMIAVIPTDYGFRDPDNKGCTVEYGKRDWLLKDMLDRWKQLYNDSIETMHNKAVNLTLEKKKENCKRLGIPWTEPTKSEKHTRSEDLEFTGSTYAPNDPAIIEDHEKHVDFVNKYNDKHSLWPTKYSSETLDPESEERQRTIMDWILRDYQDVRLEHKKRLENEQKQRTKRETGTETAFHAAYNDFVQTGADCYQTFDDPKVFGEALKKLQPDKNKILNREDFMKTMQENKSAQSQQNIFVQSGLNRAKRDATESWIKRVRREMPYLGFSGLTSKIIFEWTNFPYYKTKNPYFIRKSKIQARHRPTYPGGQEIPIKRKQWTFVTTPEETDPTVKYVHGIPVRESLDYEAHFKLFTSTGRNKRDLAKVANLGDYTNVDDLLESRTLETTETSTNQTIAEFSFQDSCDIGRNSTEPTATAPHTNGATKHVIKRDLFTGFWNIIRKMTRTKSHLIKNVERRFNIDIDKITTKEPFNMTLLLEIVSKVVFSYRVTEVADTTEPYIAPRSSFKYHSVYHKEKRAVDGFMKYVEDPIVQTVYGVEEETPSSLLRLRRSVQGNELLKEQPFGQTESWIKRVRREMPYLGFSGLTSKIIFEWTNFPYYKTKNPYFIRKSKIQARHRPTYPGGQEIPIKRKQWTFVTTPEETDPTVKYVHGIPVRESLDYEAHFRLFTSTGRNKRDLESKGRRIKVRRALGSEANISSVSLNKRSSSFSPGDYSSTPSTATNITSTDYSNDKIASSNCMVNDTSRVIGTIITNNNTGSPSTNGPTTDTGSQNPGANLINPVQTLGRKKREVPRVRRAGKDLFEKIIMAYYNCKNVWKEPSSPEILQIRRRYREQKKRKFDRIHGRRKHEHEDVYYD